MSHKTYHLGIHSGVSKSNISRANNKRPSTIFKSLAELLIKQATTLYKDRWQVEIFFKWVKQNLRIKKFYGTSMNAIETQIWIAISTYLLVAIAKKKLKLEQPLAQILNILSISLLEKEPLF